MHTFGSTKAATVSRSYDGFVLHLVLKHYWFHATVYGDKRIEYREMTDHWKKRIWDRKEEITTVRFSRGYTSEVVEYAVDLIDVGPCPIEGWDGYYYRIHFS